MIAWAEKQVTLKPSVTRGGLIVNWIYYKRACWRGSYHIPGEYLVGWSIINGRDWHCDYFWNPNHGTLLKSKRIIIAALKRRARREKKS